MGAGACECDGLCVCAHVSFVSCVCMCASVFVRVCSCECVRAWHVCEVYKLLSLRQAL